MNNTRRQKSIAFVSLFALAVGLGVLGCSTRNPNIDRVVAPYWSKVDFNKNWQSQALGEDVWHFRHTITDTGINEGRKGIADGDWLQVDRLRWEITETALIGWRDYVAVPGTNGELLENGTDVMRGERVIAFSIKQHFDIRQSYDAVTGQESNTIVENMEKPWYDRAYLRVEWTQVLNLGRATPFVMGYDVQHNDVADPDRWRFEMNNGYFETTTRQTWSTDIYSYFGYYDPSYAYDGYGSVLNIRWSFKKLDKSNDYQPLHFPNHVVMTDSEGNEIRDDNGVAKRLPIFDKFGLYRINWSGRRNYDPDRGVVSSNTDFNVTRFNIWEESVDSEGNAIPLHERTIKPIVYYPNVQHAEDLLEMTEQVVGEWNRVFQEMYYAIHDEAGTGKYASADDVDIDIIKFSKNACHVDNVVEVMKSIDSDIQDKVESAAGFTAGEIKQRLIDIWDEDSEDTFTQQTDAEDQAHLDLERICTALEWYTAGEDSPFRYQRPGDLRYNIINLVVKKAQTGWLGLGPMLADPLSGETLQAVSNLNMAYLDRSAASAARQMGAQLGETAFNDMIMGVDIRSYNREHFAHVSTIAKGVPTGHLMDEMDQRIENLREAGQLFQEIPSNYDQARRSKLAGTRIEDRIIAPDDITLFGGVEPELYDEYADLDELVLEKVSPFREGNLWEDEFLMAPNTLPNATYSVLDDALPADVAYGRILFHDATDERIAAQGSVSCASCHPDGRSDNITWQFTFGPRNTPQLGGGILETAPFHWPGDVDHFNDLETATVQAFMGGMGLGSDMAVVASFLDALPSAPNVSDVENTLSNAQERGKTIFESAEAGCTSCHSGSHFTNNLTMDIGSKARPADRNDFQVPVLHGLARSAPFMHDGSSKNIKELVHQWVKTDRMGKGSHLNADELNDLIRFLETL